MKKIMALFITILILGTLFFSGCVQVPQTNTTITSDKDAAKAIADVSSDISGVKNSLDQIDQTLTDTNSK